MQEAKVAVIKAHDGYCIVHSQPDNDDVAKTTIFGVKKGGGGESLYPCKTLGSEPLLVQFAT